MGRAPRIDLGNYVYHVLNRANARLPIFHNDADYKLFESVLEEVQQITEMRILSYVIMPNHFHLILYPRSDGDLSKFMQRLTLTHTQRWHSAHNTVGQGHLYQGRYKSFILKGDRYLFNVLRYVERNPVRANLVSDGLLWKYGSLYRRYNGTKDEKKLLSPWLIPEPKDYLEILHKPLTNDELITVRNSANKSTPYGNDSWVLDMIEEYGMQMTRRSRGRPKGT
ncbi:MAG: putative transposase [Planctomycetota bacterium]|jgi:putative transposase